MYINITIDVQILINNLLLKEVFVDKYLTFLKLTFVMYKFINIKKPSTHLQVSLH